ncbi:MAG TPA: sensor domain-containing diguanylate cyclase [Frankiaceae bacterium]|nr:sensor domain-containing diguanylate cyclase [Frankiaceae bacterium]
MIVDELRASQERYRALVELSPDAIAVIQDGLFVFANQQALSLIGARDLEELQGKPAIEVVPPPVRGPMTKRYGGLAPAQRLPYVEGQLIRLTDNLTIPIETAAAGIEYEGRPAIMVVVRDVTARHESEQAMWAAEQRFSAAFHEAPIAMLLIDPVGVVLDANPALGELVADDPRVLVGRSSLRLVHRDDRDAVRALLRTVAEKDQAVEPKEWRLERGSGELVWVQGSVAPLPGEPKMLVLHLMNITERRENEARLAHRALHDPLTGLPNRMLLTDRLEQAVRAVVREKGGVAVLYLDLDDFKEVNDTFGHGEGDRVLVEVARRLRSAVRPADTVARLGGDEFAVVAEGLPAPDALSLAERVREALRPPIGDLTVVASVGTAHSTSVGLDASALLHEADADMYRAKRRQAD